MNDSYDWIAKFLTKYLLSDDMILYYVSNISICWVYILGD